jgi:aspartate carbamoyltransferase catalytic subunit
LKWLAVGDMRMRTIALAGLRALAVRLPVTFVAPPDMSLTDEFKAELKQLLCGLQGS